MYLSLHNALFQPPLPALIGIVLVLGVVGMGRVVLGVLRFDDRFSVLSIPIVGVLILGALIQFLAFFGMATLGIVRLIDWVLVGFALCESVWLLKNRKSVVASLAGAFCFSGHEAAWQPLLVTLIFCLLCLLSLCPVTNADSLNYHLGVGLLTLSTGHVGMRPEWFNSQFAGLGEFANAAGLAAGSDIFSSILQSVALLVMFLTVSAVASSRQNKLLAIFGILSLPFLLELVPSAKPMLLPSAGLLIVVAMLLRQDGPFGLKGQLLVGLLLAFAVANKYSYLFPAITLGGWFIWENRKSGELPSVLVVLAACFALIDGPMWAFRWREFGDPLAPMMGDLFKAPSPGAHGFAEFARGYKDNQMPFVIGLFVPRTIGTISFVFLYSPLVLMGYLFATKTHNSLTIIMLATCLLELAFSQQSVRFFLDPFLWLCIAVAAGGTSRRASDWILAIVPQVAITSAMVVFGVVILSPGALASSWRESVLDRYGYRYSSMKWIDKVTPKDAVLLLYYSYPAVSPRPFMSGDGPSYASKSKHEAYARAYYKRIALERKVTLVGTVSYDVNEAGKSAGILAPCLSQRLTGPKKFYARGRNPFAARPYWVEIWNVDFQKC